MSQMHYNIRDTDWEYLSSNVPMRDVRNCPNLPWNREGLSNNKDLTLDDVDNLIMPNATKAWDWRYISMFISMDEVRNNPNRRWDKDGMSFNRNITLDDVDNLIMPNAIYKWNWRYISKYIDIEEVINDPNRTWNREGLSCNEGIELWMVDELDMPNANDRWDYAYLSQYLNAHDIIFIDEDWNDGNLVCNKTINEDILKWKGIIDNTSKWHWCWYSLSSSVDMKTICKYPKLPWDIDGLSSNPHLTVEYIKMLGIDLNWKWSKLTITIDIIDIRRNPELPWVIEWLPHNKGITLRDMDLISCKRWDIMRRNLIPSTLDRNAFCDVNFIIT